MAAHRLPSLVLRSLSSSLPLPCFASLLQTIGRGTKRRRNINRFSTVAEIDELVTPPVEIRYTKNLINGEFVDAVSGDQEDINRAVSATRKAFDEGRWPKMTPYERSRLLLRIADTIEKHSDELATLETRNNGKLYEQAAKIELPLVVRLLHYYAGARYQY
ncbi:Aldehyde dehydrogenase family 2 member B4 [Spatholobus suberectus]|nr:Aldehyde dehydrogenase family 2 member B4 [Spatholobus suberectus]